MAREERRAGDLRSCDTWCYVDECWPWAQDPLEEALAFFLCPRSCHLVRPFYILITSIIHFLLGIAAYSTGLSIPVTIAYTAYQVYDSYTHYATAPNNPCRLKTKYRLRRDIATYIAGLLLQPLLNHTPH